MSSDDDGWLLITTLERHPPVLFDESKNGTIERKHKQKKKELSCLVEMFEDLFSIQIFFSNRRWNEQLIVSCQHTLNKTQRYILDLFIDHRVLNCRHFHRWTILLVVLIKWDIRFSYLTLPDLIDLFKSIAIRSNKCTTLSKLNSKRFLSSFFFFICSHHQRQQLFCFFLSDFPW